MKVDLIAVDFIKVDLVRVDHVGVDLMKVDLVCTHQAVKHHDELLHNFHKLMILYAMQIRG